MNTSNNTETGTGRHPRNAIKSTLYILSEESSSQGPETPECAKPPCAQEKSVPKLNNYRKGAYAELKNAINSSISRSPKNSETKERH